ncbi:hypothetical protein [Vibrio sp. V10_P2A27P122]|uniref:hypothetical protein n=1 Tax=Vibrio sp. V10_P2A27P122 TaxID=1938665 RepID=UPI000B8EE475|nr:hypothetical protein [Vibrio sp. V10_P2A27P122]OXX57726.1 hypothetical protein B9J82_09665 [Vibrio sp. V10_P2A27P122]
MRSAINTALFILFLLLAFLTSVASHAAVCPIGNTPSLKWPLGTARIASACVDGCRASEGINGQDTWTCSDKLQYCTGYFVTTGDTCTGSDDTNGTCDANGTCTDNGGSNPDPDPTDPHYNHVIDGQLAVMPGVISGLDSSSAQLAKALRIGAYMNAEVAKSTHIISPLLADLIDVNRGQSNILSNMANKNAPNYSETLHSILSTLHSINNNSGNSGSGGLPEQQFNSFMGSISGLNGTIYSAANNINTNLQEIKQTVRPLDWKLDETNRQLYDVNNNIGSGIGVLLEHGLTNTASIVDAIKSSGGTGGGDNSSVVDAIGAQTGEIKGSLDALSDALSTGSYVSREFKGKVDFDTVGLYKPDLLESVLADTEELKQQYEQQIDEFKKIFSFDVSQLNSGQYKEHSLDFVLPNGKQLNLKSGVLPAFIDQANLIAAVILFVAAIIAVKAILGSRK